MAWQALSRTNPKDGGEEEQGHGGEPEGEERGRREGLGRGGEFGGGESPDAEAAEDVEVSSQRFGAGAEQEESEGGERNTQEDAQAAVGVGQGHRRRADIPGLQADGFEVAGIGKGAEFSFGGGEGKAPGPGVGFGGEGRGARVEVEQGEDLTGKQAVVEAGAVVGGEAEQGCAGADGEQDFVSAGFAEEVGGEAVGIDAGVGA